MMSPGAARLERDGARQAVQAGPTPRPEGLACAWGVHAVDAAIGKDRGKPASVPPRAGANVSAEQSVCRLVRKAVEESLEDLRKGAVLRVGTVEERHR